MATIEAGLSHVIEAACRHRQQRKAGLAGLLIPCHRSNAGCDQVGTEECRKAGSEEQLMKEIRQAYTGKVVAGHDLEVY